ncbi:uncharacterized protein CMU_041160 [Cryptosporidium muris RN66]|uniref:Uncharacterized protein n=1 Tax=Cryptosporidium muris (strain RN66) TaxID=441375 RepID=B6AA05_CRYMR|nr:uncharacterized protein CMU_041160 [Cryptosporidium muris RN66]EEA05046.1 hypothetical protein CMU_041160 [Cryptosporidium muris RN66]|eukprot:XP_002139395.1 hypothetical protein [Cryptosporidium muris RN66]
MVLYRIILLIYSYYTLQLLAIYANFKLIYCDIRNHVVTNIRKSSVVKPIDLETKLHVFNHSENYGSLSNIPVWEDAGDYDILIENPSSAISQLVTNLSDEYIKSMQEKQSYYQLREEDYDTIDSLHKFFPQSNQSATDSKIIGVLNLVSRIVVVKM